MFGFKKEKTYGELEIVSKEIENGVEVIVKGLSTERHYFHTIKALIEGLSKQCGRPAFLIALDLVDIVTNEE